MPSPFLHSIRSSPPPLHLVFPFSPPNPGSYHPLTWQRKSSYFPASYPRRISSFTIDSKSKLVISCPENDAGVQGGGRGGEEGHIHVSRVRVCTLGRQLGRYFHHATVPVPSSSSAYPFIPSLPSPRPCSLPTFFLSATSLKRTKALFSSASLSAS